MKTSILLAALVPMFFLAGCGGGGEKKASVVPQKVFLIRHCDYQPIGGGLSDKGRKQAAGIAGKLKSENIALILHSSVKRCDETAKIVWEQLSKPKIRSVDWLHEDSRTGADWAEEIAGGGNVLIVTHTPVIQQITDKPNATSFGEVTRIK
jgi:phosphohistidine phosphatase SixA